MALVRARAPPPGHGARGPDAWLPPAAVVGGCDGAGPLMADNAGGVASVGEIDNY